VGFYRDRIFLAVMNRTMDTAETRRIRAEVCAPLAGEVVEIGFGTGLNLPHLPTAVTRLGAVDPLERGRLKAADRLAATHIPVEFVGLDGQRLELDDDSVDVALSTWTLCSIPDPVAAVREIRRVLRPGGAFHFAEHGLAPAHDERVRQWQHRLNPLQQRVACGCQLTTDIPSIVERGGLVIDRLKTFYAKGNPKIVGWTYQGVATSP
jgi:ubiquinone/menaquinone biosynthesis C-methylase UbiE